MRFATLNRKLHRWSAALIAAPLLVIIVSGIVLQLKKESGWIQPPAQQGAGGEPAVSFEGILEAVKAVPEAEVEGWADIARIDSRPADGMIKVRSRNNWEVQVDTQTGGVLQVAFRRSDLIESLHDGSFFHRSVKLYVFLPAGIILFGLWVTGICLFLRPYFGRPRGGREAAPARAGATRAAGTPGSRR